MWSIFVVICWYSRTKFFKWIDFILFFLVNFEVLLNASNGIFFGVIVKQFMSFKISRAPEFGIFDKHVSVKGNRNYRHSSPFTDGFCQEKWTNVVGDAMMNKKFVLTIASIHFDTRLWIFYFTKRVDTPLHWIMFNHCLGKIFVIKKLSIYYYDVSTICFIKN